MTQTSKSQTGGGESSQPESDEPVPRALALFQSLKKRKEEASIQETIPEPPKKKTVKAVQEPPRKKITIPKKLPTPPLQTSTSGVFSKTAGITTHDIVPPSSSSQTTIARPRLWDVGVTKDFAVDICPPEIFVEPKRYTDEAIKQLATMEVHSLKTATLIQSLVTLNERYSTTSEECRRLEEAKTKAENDCKTAEEKRKNAEDDRKKAEEGLSTAKEEIRKTDNELARIVSVLKSTAADLEKEKTIRQQQGQTMSNLKAAHELLEKDHEGCTQKLAEAESNLQEKQQMVDELQYALGLALAESFDNAVKQMRFLNPGVTLNTSGMHYEAYVTEKGDRLVPPPPSEAPPPPPPPQTSPEGVSVSRMVGDLTVEAGDEAGSKKP